MVSQASLCSSPESWHPPHHTLKMGQGPWPCMAPFLGAGRRALGTRLSTTEMALAGPLSPGLGDTAMRLCPDVTNPEAGVCSWWTFDSHLRAVGLGPLLLPVFCSLS